jgi:hypothetical protein
MQVHSVHRGSKEARLTRVPGSAGFGRDAPGLHRVAWDDGSTTGTTDGCGATPHDMIRCPESIAGRYVPIAFVGSAFHRSRTNIRKKERTAMVHTHRITLALVALLGLLGAAPQRATATSQLPFKATITETSAVAACTDPDQVCFSLVGSGHTTHLGKTSATTQVIVDLLSAPGPTADCHTNTRPVMTLTGANGDQLTLALSGVSCDTGATTGVTGVSHDTYIVTGGTGRYSGATGSGTATVSIYAADGFSRIVFNGTLSIPGAG